MKTKTSSLASMLVTQVQYGQSRPYIPAGMNLECFSSMRDNIVLAEQKEKDKGRKTLVLDLDETLVHSSFQPVSKSDLVLPVEIEGQT